MAEFLSQENGEAVLSQGSSYGSKSPGKGRKLTLGSIFRRSGTDESGIRGSGKERGSSRSRKKISRESKSSNDTTLDTHPNTNTHLTVSTEMGKNEEQRPAASIKEISQMQFKEFEEELQEPEQKSVGDLHVPTKKIQKRNKELSKQNNQLTKSVDALKKEREELLSDKHKLKSENRTLERELRRVSSKGDVQRFKKSSQVSVEAADFEAMQEMAAKVQTLEAHLAEKDKKLRRLRDRLLQVNIELPDVGEPPLSTESSRRESEIVPPGISQNGGVIDSSMVERLLDERNKSSKLELENSELKTKMAALESNLVQLQTQMAALDNKEGGEIRTRKRSGSFFKRGKAHSKSMVMKSSEDVLKEREASKEQETRRSKSPDFISASDSFQDMSEMNTLSHTDSKAASSLPSFVHSGLSPRTAAKQAHGEIQTLQSCLKLAIQEKKTLDEKIKQLEAELVAAQKKMKEMVDSLQKENTELSGKVSALKTSQEKLKSDKLALEKQLADLTAEKDSEVSQLKDKISQLETKLTESERIRKEDEDVFMPINSTKQTTVKPNTDTKQTKTSKSVTSKLPPAAPGSPSKSANKDGESGHRVRKQSQPKMRRRSSSSSLPDQEPYDSVANTRAMFEQKIESTREEKQSPKITTRKISWTGERRGSYSNSSPGLKVVGHAKSSSFDASKFIELPKNVEKDQKTTAQQTAPKPSSEQKLKSQPTPASDSTPAVTKPTTLDFNKAGSATSTKVQSFTSTNRDTTPVSKVSKIIVKSTASPSGSPVLGRQKSADEKENSSVKLLKQISVPVTSTTSRSSSVTTPTSAKPPNSSSPVLPRSLSVDTKQPSVPVTSTTSRSPSVTTPTSAKPPNSSSPALPRSLSVDSKQDAPVKVPTVTTTNVKKTRSNTVTLSNSGSSSPTHTGKVTITTSSSNTSNAKQTEPVVLRRTGNARTAQRPQSMLEVPSSVKKAFSLQNIPEQTSSESTTETTPTPVTTETVVRRSPVQLRLQRRERSERPKTMYAGRAETTNLVNLISRFQQQEAAKKDNSKFDGGRNPPAQTKLMNGSSSPTPSPTHSHVRAATVNTPVIITPSSPKVTLRKSPARGPRPNSYYGSPNEKIVTIKSPSSPLGYKKPPPSERKLVRAQTVGTGLGFNRNSKKAMLLRWCQRETDAYDNVHIQNFDASFSDGLAFCALMHHFMPDKVAYNSLSSKNRQHNFTLAFKVAEEAGIPSLLDVEDMVDLPIPDWMSVMTYVSFIYNKFGQPNNSS